MPINYSLRENHLTSDPDDYMALVHSRGTVDEEMIIKQMLNRGTTLTKADALAALQLYHQVILDAVAEGYNVVTPAANYSASIKGVFTGMQDSFDPSRHSLEPNVNPGRILRQVMRQANTIKQETGVNTPNLVDFYDFGSSTRNSLATPGNGGRIAGHRLKFDMTDDEQGIFFVNGGGTATRMETIMTNKPAELIFLIPTLASGEYRLEVRAMFGKTIRSGTLLAPLNVP